jgi:hypothetical protein
MCTVTENEDLTLVQRVARRPCGGWQPPRLQAGSLRSGEKRVDVMLAPSHRAKARILLPCFKQEDASVPTR